MKRKTAIVAMSYLCAASALLGLYAALRKNGEEIAERRSRYAGEYAFEELCAASAGLSEALEKGSLATSPGLEATLCADAYARSLSALTALGQLPFSTVEMVNTSAFLGRTGDYARCHMRSSALGQELSEEERHSLAELSETAGWLSGALKTLRGEITEGLTCAGECRDALFALEEEFPETGTLRYDGSYSQGEKEYALLKGKGECSERDAALIAADFLDLNGQNAVVAGECGDALRCWYVTGEDCSLLISQQGGQVVQLTADRLSGEATLSKEEAAAAGDEFLRKHSYDHMVLTESVMERDCFVGTWCYEQDGVLCCPDEVRMAVSLEDGNIVGFDAEEYVAHHTRRALDTHTYAWDDARTSLAPSLTVEEERLAVIATPGGEEKLCLCFRCRSEEGRECLVFCSAATGAQERIELIEAV